MSSKRQRTPDRSSPSSPFSSCSHSSSTVLSIEEKKEEPENEETFTLVCFHIHGEACENDTYVVYGITAKQLDVFDKLLNAFKAKGIEQSLLIDLFSKKYLDWYTTSEEDFKKLTLDFNLFTVMEKAVDYPDDLNQFIQHVPKKYYTMSSSRFNERKFNNVAARTLMDFK